jgi:hypothetical protein
MRIIMMDPFTPRTRELATPQSPKSGCEPTDKPQTIQQRPIGHALYMIYII